MDTEELEAAGVTVPTGSVLRGASWIYLMGHDDRLTDLLAFDYMAARVAALPADESGKGTAARWLARRAVRWARAQVIAWNHHADELTAASPVFGPSLASSAMAAAQRTAAGTAATAAMVIAASVDPMGGPRWSLALEHAGTGILKASGHAATRPDVWSRRHGQHVTRPDRVAFRGTARYHVPQALGYGRHGTMPASIVLPVIDPVGTATTVEAFLSVVRRRAFHAVPTVIVERDDNGKITARRTTHVRRAFPDNGQRVAFYGHDVIRWTVVPRGTTAARTAARTARAQAGSVGKRGPARGPWSLAVRSLPAAMARNDNARQRATALESLLRTAAADGVLTFGPVSVTVVGNAEAIAHDGRAWPVREWCQRAALAGIDPAAI